MKKDRYTDGNTSTNNKNIYLDYLYFNIYFLHDNFFVVQRFIVDSTKLLSYWNHCIIGRIFFVFRVHNLKNWKNIFLKEEII